MSENSKIEWCDHTFNPWEGCQKVGPGCDNCYAEARNARFAGGTAINWGPGATRRRTSPANWRKPLQWNAQHEAFYAQHGRRQRVFCASLADVFDNAVPQYWRTALFGLIFDTPNLDWLLLTKRIGNATDMLRGDPPEGIAMAELPNLWIGATVCNQEEADRDIPKLLATPARVRFLSIEPMLGPVYVEQIPDPAGGVCLKPLAGLRWVGDGQGRCTVRSLGGRIDWVIAGGESGPQARPAHPDWFRSLHAQCASAGVPFLFKQWGEYTAGELSPHPDHPGSSDAWRVDQRGQRWHAPTESGMPLNQVDQVRFIKVGKKAAGRQLDGIEHNGFPEAR